MDLRSYGRAVRLDAAGGEQLFVPAGFAPGFCPLAPDTMVAYKVDAYHGPADDRNLRWNDPALGIDWPVTEADAILSGKDRAAPFLADLGRVFRSGWLGTPVWSVDPARRLV